MWKIKIKSGPLFLVIAGVFLWIAGISIVHTNYIQIQAGVEGHSIQLKAMDKSLKQAQEGLAQTSEILTDMLVRERAMADARSFYFASKTVTKEQFASLKDGRIFLHEPFDAFKRNERVVVLSMQDDCILQNHGIRHPANYHTNWIRPEATKVLALRLQTSSQEENPDISKITVTSVCTLSQK